MKTHPVPEEPLPQNIGPDYATEQQCPTAVVLTFGPHADSQAFFQPALLALAPHVHVDLAVVAVFALVHGIFGNAPPKEAFASFARERVVMVTGRTVAAYQAQLLGRAVVEHDRAGPAAARPGPGPRGVDARAACGDDGRGGCGGGSGGGGGNGGGGGGGGGGVVKFLLL